MTTLPAELEALMPKPSFRLTWYNNTATYHVSKPNIGGDHDCYTADQMREAILAATERAAKLATQFAYDAAIKYADGYVVDFDQEVGDAIRARTGGGQT